MSGSTKNSLDTREQAADNREPNSTSVKHSVGDAANQWMERNRSLVLRQTPFWAQSVTRIVIILGSLAVGGGFFFRIDEVVTVQGQLKSIGGTVEVKTPAGGRISKTYVSDGDLVKKGQLLVTFDTREAKEKQSTLTRLIQLEKKSLLNQLKTIESQNQILIGRVSVVKKKLNTQNEITQKMNELVATGGYQRIQYLNQLDRILELEVQIAEMQQQITNLQLQKEQLRLQSEKSIDQMTNELKLAELQILYQTINAPKSGIVFDSKVREEGVTASGERLLSIVPQNGLFAEVFVPNKDIGFVKKDQKAKVRVDAFPFTRYGELNAVVSNIGADALPPDSENNSYRFPITLNLDKSYLVNKDVKIPLKAGMAVTTNLKLRDKRVISLLSDMLVDQTDSVRSIRQQ